MVSTGSRTLTLLSLLQSRRWWPGPELAERLDVSERTLRRDVERLRELGYPVEARRGLAGGYQLGVGAALPPLLVDDEEAVALALATLGRLAERRSPDGSEDAALRALTKLVQGMPARLRRRLDAVRSVTSHVAWNEPAQAPPLDGGVLTTLALACRDDERVRFTHRREEGEERERHVEPHRLVALSGHWYLVAFDLDRHDWRTFRLDRVRGAAGTRVSFAPRRPPFDDAGAFVREGVRRPSGAERAELLVELPAEKASARLGRWAQVTPVDTHRCRVVVVGESLDWPLFAAGSLGAEFRVLSPPELVERAEDWGRRFARAVP